MPTFRLQTHDGQHDTIEATDRMPSHSRNHTITDTDSRERARPDMSATGSTHTFNVYREDQHLFSLVLTPERTPPPQNARHPDPQLDNDRRPHVRGHLRV